MGGPKRWWARCQALDSKGKQCRKEGVTQVEYHGEHEIYYKADGRPDQVSWVKIWLCESHKKGSE